MSAKTGVNTVIGVTLSPTIDVVTAATTGHKMLVNSLNHDKNTTELKTSPVGSGLSMQQDSDTGDFSPEASIDKMWKTDDQGIALLCAMMGVESSTTATGSGYVRSITYNANSITNFVNLGLQADDTNVQEYINGVVKKFTLSLNPNDFLKSSFDALFTNRRITGTTNTVSSLNSATEPSNSVITVRPSHYVRINAQAGAGLSNSDAVAVVDAKLELSVPWELIGEIKGSAGYGAQRRGGDGLLMATLTCTFRNTSETSFAYVTAFEAGTEYKADFIVQGALISGSTYNQLQCFLPRLRVVADPNDPVSQAGDNQRTVVFKGLVATSAPTGQFSVYPHFTVINGKSTRYLQ